MRYKVPFGGQFKIQFMQFLAGNSNQPEVEGQGGVMNPELPKFHFTIEGNIGCGKSTIVELMRQRMPEARWIEEPVSQWQNLSGKKINMLEKYYIEPKRWGFTFQIYAIFTRVQKLHEATQRHPDKVKISERSVLADKYVFSELMKDLGYMNQAEHEVFKSLYRSFQQMAEVERTKIIYLKCTPEKCHQRTKSRMRPEETEISFDYLKLIHEKHEKWFKAYPAEKVLVIDTTEDFKDSPEKIADFLERIKRFME